MFSDDFGSVCVCVCVCVHRGRNFKPVYAYWAEAARKQGRAAPAMRGRSTTGRRTALNKRTAGAALTGQLDDDREVRR